MITIRYRWPDLIQYALAHHCPTCLASAGQKCNAPRKQATPRGDDPEFHATRYTTASSHYYRDVGNAPWADEREPGRCYCTLDPCPLATTP